MRPLPTKQNPRVVPEETPAYEELLELRRLGRTKLSVKPGQVSTSNATKTENLGHFEYVHLRAPLPEDLEDSEILSDSGKRDAPSTYFFMRRHKDGYVSATGMFKIAFPWATKSEEKAEEDYLYSLDTTSRDNTAGNVWIAPEYSLQLAEEYGLKTWIRALLDSSDIAQSSKKAIAQPPKFDLPADDSAISLPPPRELKTPRSRSTRSMSPAKALQAAPSTISKAKSPRKRQTKAQKEAEIADANAASATLQSSLDDAASAAEIEEVLTQEVSKISSEDPTSSGEEEDEQPSSPTEEKVTIEVEQAVEITNGTEITHTNVTVSMPAGLPELPLPEDTEAMLEKAKQMVEEARALEASPKLVRKRKVEEVDPSDIDKELPVQPAKKARVLEEKLKRERVRTRALVGVGAMLGIAAAIPYFF